MPTAVTAISAWLVAAGASAAVATFIAEVFVYAATTYLLNRAAAALAPSRHSQGLGSGDPAHFYAAECRIVHGVPHG